MQAPGSGCRCPPARRTASGPASMFVRVCVRGRGGGGWEVVEMVVVVVMVVVEWDEVEGGVGWGLPCVDPTPPCAAVKKGETLTPDTGLSCLREAEHVAVHVLPPTLLHILGVLPGRGGGFGRPVPGKVLASPLLAHTHTHTYTHHPRHQHHHARASRWVREGCGRRRCLVVPRPPRRRG